MMENYEPRICFGEDAAEIYDVEPVILTQKDVESKLERVDPTLNGKGPCTRRERI